MSIFEKIVDYYGRVTNVTRAAEAMAPSTDGATRKRIVCVSHDAGFYGAQLLLLHIDQILKDQIGYQVTTVLLGGGPLDAQFEQIGEVVRFDNPPWREPPSPEILRARQAEIRRLFQEGARHVICNTSVSGHVVRMFKEEGFQVIVLVHELPNLIREFHLESAVKEIGRWADHVVFPAAFVRDRFLPIAGLDPSRAILRPQGLYQPTPFRGSRPEARAHQRAQLGLAPETRVVVAVGQGDRRKGIDLFCQVALHVVRELPSVHFVWIGDDSTELARDCKAWIQVAGIAEKVHFTGVLKEALDCLGYVAGADLYLMTSREDPYPSVVLEALDAGIPVVGFNDAGGFAELLAAGAGVLVPYEDREAMAGAVKGLLLDESRSKLMGDEGQRIIDTRFYFPDYVYDLIRIVGLPHRKISVVIPNYNYARYLPTRLGTILAQTYRPYEIIFLDDNSTDESVAIAESMLSTSGIPYRIVRNDVNHGCYSQWLSGVEMARGELLWIAEADDECEPELLEELVKGFDDSSVVLAYAQSKKMDQDGAVTRGDYLDYTNDLSETKWTVSYSNTGTDEIRDFLSIKNTIPNASAVLMKKPDLSEIRERLIQFKNAGDWLAYVHILKSGSIYFTSKVLNAHRVHIGGVTRGGNALRHMSEIIQVQEYIRSQYDLQSVTLEKIESMRQFVYQYLGLDAGGVGLYRDHPDLKLVLADKAGMDGAA